MRSVRVRSFPVIPGAASLAALLLLSTAGCDAERGEARGAERVAIVDSVLSELGGVPTMELSRGQRWRMISSMGAGLPPSTFEAGSLPDPTSRGATLLQAYCQRCHGLPAPQMHAAAEWPVLVRRMVMRARTLQDRMGGPATSDMMGEILMAGMASADVPTQEDVDVLIGYMQAHALPVAETAPAQDDVDGQLFVRQCSQCHETPSPRAHTAEEWRAVVDRMRMNTALMDIGPIPDEDAARVISWLEAQAR